MVIVRNLGGNQEARRQPERRRSPFGPQRACRLPLEIVRQHRQVRTGTISQSDCRRELFQNVTKTLDTQEPADAGPQELAFAQTKTFIRAQGNFGRR